MKLTINKWGNSAAVRLSSTILKQLGIKEGDQLDILVENDKIILTPVKQKPRYVLDELIAGITPENRHDEIW